MQLTDADLQEFCAIWKTEFNEELTLDEARHRASQLLELYFLLAQTEQSGDHKSPEALPEPSAS